ncbi:MAG: hypothetical protein EU551_02015 [Promethearchaeota archaeon]|nr:MAG: hypothetical protein EU551_02015 [Candidatus Lokiarchaeota archaeon]
MVRNFKLLTLLDTLNWDVFFQDEKVREIYTIPSEIDNDIGLYFIEYRVIKTSNENINGLTFEVIINPSEIDFNRQDFCKFLEICKLFTNTLKGVNIIIEKNKWIYYTNTLDFSEQSIKVLYKILDLVIFIFEDLRKKVR